MTTKQKKALSKSDEEKKADRIKRKESHVRKRSHAMTRLSMKVAALGDNALLDEYEAAAYFDKSVQWLRNRRIYGGGPPVVRIGSSVRYKLSELKSEK